MSLKNSTKAKIDLNEIREKLSAKNGQGYWRSLEQVAQTNEFQDYLKHEFPAEADIWSEGLQRRRFLQLMGASLALAGFTGCTRQPDERIVPYVKAPEQLIPGKPLFYASTVSFQGYGQGIIVESHDGRPTKIEGNPRHPASLGATSLLAQASILELYDPDRMDVVSLGGRVRTWERFSADLKSEVERFRSSRGKGLAILTGTVTSPTMSAQIDALLRELPELSLHNWEPVNSDNLNAGAELAYGRSLNSYCRFDRAETIVSLDSDFLFSGPAAIRYAKDFSRKRRVDSADSNINRLYVAESSPTLTGTLADHKLLERSSRIGPLAIQLASHLAEGIEEVSTLTEEERAWAEAAAADLRAHAGASIVIAGEHQPPAVHALVHLINETLGNKSKTVVYTEPVESFSGVQMDSIRNLVEAIEGGRVETLLILGGNPVFDAPADLNFAEALTKVNLKIHLVPSRNETSILCNWQVPESHYLESWGDARAFDGTASIIQPLIEPIFRSKSAIEILGIILGDERNGYEIVRGYWESQYGQGDFEKWWRRSLHEGIIENSAFLEESPNLDTGSVKAVVREIQTDTDGVELIFRPDPSVYDGRYSNNGWLQELPKPLTKLTWDNAFLVSPAMASELELANGDVVDVKTGSASVRGPIWIQPGHPPDAVTVHFGYGRTEVGRVGKDTGFDAFKLRTSTNPWFLNGVEIENSGANYDLACTQDHNSMEGRNLVRSGTIQELASNPHLIHEMGHEPTSESDLYPGFEYDGNAWGMAVDLNACIGCNACVVACQSENNIAVVGKEQVMNGREMHWIRVDRYYKGPLDDPETLHQPVMCQHCENAPCESVCPVAATVHSDEGLNDMVYNRCVGTRYCSNNCPYKVRRFNFLLYSDWQTETLKLQRNPNVTVRSRGVMEKCTYCVQRINAARIQSSLEDREISDGEIKTACQQVCPTDAIVFGDINNPDSEVSQLKKNQRNYGVLTEFNTKPRTTYLAKIRNPNDSMEDEA